MEREIEREKKRELEAEQRRMLGLEPEPVRKQFGVDDSHADDSIPF